MLPILPQEEDEALQQQLLPNAIMIISNNDDIICVVNHASISASIYTRQLSLVLNNWKKQAQTSFPRAFHDDFNFYVRIQ